MEMIAVVNKATADALVDNAFELGFKKAKIIRLVDGWLVIAYR